LNAADFQIAPSLRLAMSLDDLRAAIEHRPSGELALRVVPNYPGRIPPVLPAAWLEPLRAPRLTEAAPECQHGGWRTRCRRTQRGAQHSDGSMLWRFAMDRARTELEGAVASRDEEQRAALISPVGAAPALGLLRIVVGDSRKP
jgi:hypothetical protein